jgi:hypothetical protein
MKVYRQGDVIVSEAKVPRRAEHVGNEVRIASETGNAHVLPGKAYRSGRLQYVVLEEPTQMTHPQHAALTLPAGTYGVRTVNDYIPRRMLD